MYNRNIGRGGTFVKISHYIPKLAWDNVRKKKSRSFLSFVSVLLSSAIIFVSFTLFLTVFSLSKTLDDPTLGTAHYGVLTTDVAINNPHQFQSSQLGKQNQNNLAYYRQDENSTFFLLVEGVMPDRTNQILAVADGTNTIGMQIAQYEVCGLYQPTAFMKQVVNNTPYLSKDESLMTEESYFFIHDTRIQDDGSLANVAKMANLPAKNITMNEDVISHDTIANYLQDTTMILGMFILIVFIATIMCLVSIYNVLIVNDQDRRKEIGLLKSIGITIKELKAMLVIELSIIGLAGGIVGVCLGMLVSGFVLNSILVKLKATLSISLLIHPAIIFEAILAGVVLMVGSGYLLYHHYFYSSPITDLKGEPVQYDVPYNADRFSINSVTWRMFIIYNERIKKQTRNLLRSFLLVMLTITLFSGIWFSNLFYKMNYTQNQADLEITQSYFTLGSRELYEDVDQIIYDLAGQTDTAYDSAVIERTVLGDYFYTPVSSFSNEYLNNKHKLSTKEVADVVWNTEEVHFGMVLNDKQLSELTPYIEKGDIASLDENSAILIYYQYDYYTYRDSCRDLSEPFQVMAEPINLTGGIQSPQFFDVDLVVALPYEKLDLKYSNVDDHKFVIAFTPDSVQGLVGQNLSISYDAKVMLESTAGHSEVNEYFNQRLLDAKQQGNLEVSDYIQIRNDGKFATFIIEVLFYPLLGMVVLIGIININNVLKGNIHIKHTDFATMKSVGMTTSQLRMVMLYEYIENYLNAGAITFLLCIPVYLIEQLIPVASTFKVGDNFAGMFIMSFALISPLIIFGLSALSFRCLKSITALDSLKDIT